MTSERVASPGVGSALEGDCVDILLAHSMQCTSPNGVLEPTESVEEDLHTFMSAQSTATSIHICSNGLRSWLWQCQALHDTILRSTDGPRELAASDVHRSLSCVPTTPSLRAESLATSRSGTPTTEHPGEDQVHPLPSTASDVQPARATTLDDISTPAALAQIGIVSIGSPPDLETVALAFSGLGQQNPITASELSDDSSRQTVGSCLGKQQPSTIPGGFSSKFPPLNIFVKIRGQDEYEGFRAIQDTGCNVNVMKAEIWRRLGQHPLYDRGKRLSIYGLSGKTVVLGCMKLYFFIEGYGDKPFKTEFQVVPDKCMGVDALLCGMFVDRLPVRN